MIRFLIEGCDATKEGSHCDENDIGILRAERGQSNLGLRDQSQI